MRKCNTPRRLKAREKAVLYIIAMCLPMLATGTSLLTNKGSDRNELPELNVAECAQHPDDDRYKVKIIANPCVADQCPGFAEAATLFAYTWNVGNGDWTNPGRWTPNGVPGASDDAVISTPENIVTLTEDEEINNLTLGVGPSIASTTLSGNFGLVVHGDLAQDGRNYLSGNTTVQGDFIWGGGHLGNSGTSADVTVAGLTTIHTGVPYLLGNTLHVNGGAVQTTGMYITFDALLPGDESEWNVTFAANNITLEYLGAAECVSGGIIYVDADATGLTDGTSWINAFTTLQDALSVACACEDPVQVWVAGGTYYPDEGAGQTNNSLTSTFQLCNDVILYGGFAGDELNLEDRDWVANETMLSGDINEDGMLSGNARHVVTGSGTNTSAVIDGFTITAGNADADGGGFYNISGSPSILNCYIHGNAANIYGGGMYNGNMSNPVVVNTIISGNSATVSLFPQGGGVYNISSSPTFINCVFSGNASKFGGGVFTSVSVGPSSPIFTNCSFSGNSATSGGAAIYNNNGSHADIMNCVIWNNSNNGITTSTTASIFNNASTATISYSLVANSGGSGGGWQAAIGTDGGNNIDVDPLFALNVDPSTAPTTAGNLRMQSLSPPIDLGNTAANSTLTDPDGNARVAGVDIDMGAYEFDAGSCIVTWYADADADGLGDPGVSQEACEAPVGYVANDNDCDDTNDQIGGPTTWYADTDEDGFGDPAVSQEACQAPSGFVANDDDCDDTDDQIGLAPTWYADTDGDGLGDANDSQEACEAPIGYVANADDCDDTNDAIGGPTSWYADTDEDGLGDPNDSQEACEAPVGYVANADDCDDTDDEIGGPSSWYADTDEDGFGNSGGSLIACDQPIGYVDNDNDCDDADPMVNPNADELCNGIDDDCDGLVDGADPDVLGQSLSGTVTVGASGNYHSLTETGMFGLFNAINANGLSGDLIVEILDAAVTETGAVVLNEISDIGCDAGQYTLTIKPATGVVTVLSGTHATTLIDLNGADHVIIDGSNNGSSSKDMTIRNSSSTGHTMRFINGAAHNTVRNTIIESANSTFFTGSAIMFWTAPGPEGNSNNLIHNCDIRDLSNAASVLTNGVFSNDNTDGAPNVNNTISGCHIFNWTRRGVHLFSDDWTVSECSFYQTAPRTTMLEAIELSGNGHQVIDNYIGGSEPFAEGTFMSTTNIFRGISLGNGTITPFSVQGNTIKNIRSTYVGYNSSYGIFLYYGSANIGTIEGNTIGSSDINERIEANGDGFGIRVTSTFSANVSNNNVDHFGTNATPAAAQWFSGISIEGVGGAHVVENNTIMHVTNAGTPDATFSSETYGLRVLATGVQTVRGNVIHDIGSTSAVAPTAQNNKVWGLFVSGTAPGTVVEKNIVYNIYASSVGTGARADVITLLQSQSAAHATYSNNMLSGAELSGSSGRFFTGILDLSSSPAVSNYYSNTISISGTATGANSTYAFNRSGTASVDIKNNIFSNTRSGGTGFHIAIANTNPSATGWPATASDYNNLYNHASAHLAQWLGSSAGNNRNLTGWQASQADGTPGSGGDANAISVQPVFASNVDLHLTSANYLLDNLGIPTGGITEDIDGEMRDVTTPDMGADEFVSVHPCPGFDDVVYVDANATGANNGTSWVDAYHSLQDAIAIACSCPALSQIWVAEGTYYPDEGTDQTNNLLTSTFHLCNGVSIYGGFTGDEISLNERDWVTNETILHGDVDQNSALSNNAYHVVTGSGTNSTAVLDGFTISGGNANGVAYPDNRGGGLLSISGAPQLANLLFAENHASILGGAMGIQTSAPIITASRFMNNTSALDAGAVHLDGAPAVFIDCEFSGNTAATNGGAVLVAGMNPSFTSCSFTANQANNGGAVYTWSTIAVYTNCVFSGNRAITDGGALYAYFNSNSNLINCSFSGNSAGASGGGIYNWLTPNLNAVNSIVWNNSAAGVTNTSSASIYHNSANATFSYSLIANSGGSEAWQSTIGTDGGNNIDVDPEFFLDVNPASAPTATGDLRLQSSSQAIDSGNNVLNNTPQDLDGNNRIVGGVIDLGPYENQQEPIDCVVSAWSEWSSCSEECGPGMRCRTRIVLVEPNAFGLQCPSLEECEPCNDGPCPTCDDGMMNGNEQGIDCGGPDCAPCGPPNAVCGGFTVYVNQDTPDYDGPGTKNVWLIDAEDLDGGSTSQAIASAIKVKRYLSNIPFDWTTNGACIDLVPNGGAINSADKGIVYRDCYPAITADFNKIKLYRLQITDIFGSDECSGTVRVLHSASALQAPSMHFVIPKTEELISIAKPNLLKTDEESAVVDALVVFPNPGSDLLQLQWNALQDGHVDITIVDMSGQKILNQRYEALHGANLVIFDMTAQPAGMYAVLVKTLKEVMHVKWIKQ